MSKELIATVNGLDIRTESVYKITGKVDYSAPSGYVELGVSKLPTAGVGSLISVRFKQTGTKPEEGLFDTGFYLESPCYSEVDETTAKQTVAALQKHIVKPYERIYGEGVLSHSNKEFWEEFHVKLEMDKVFSTDSLKDLLGLYIALRSYELTPKSLIGDPRFSNSDYVIEDKEKVKTIKEERTTGIMDAIATFGSLLKTDKENLVHLTRYIGIRGLTATTDDGTMKSAFFDWLNQHNENPKKFQDAAGLLLDAKTQDIIPLYIILEEALRKKEVTRDGAQLVYKGKKLGADLKTAASNLNSKKDLEEIKIEIINDRSVEKPKKKK